MPFKSAKQKKFFEAVAHGMKPKNGSKLSKKTAQKFILDSGDDSGLQLDNQPVIFKKKPIAQARKRKGK